MVSAPVGFQCPECVAEAAATTRRPTSVFGGGVHANQVAVTATLVAVNVGVYLLGWLVPSLASDFALLPVAVADGQWYRLLTATFLHAGLLHLGLNMYSLWVLGGLLEPLLGRRRFAVLYVTSALAGSALSYAFLDPFSFALGASGAVYGLLGAALVVMRRLSRDVTAVLAVLIVNLVLSFAWHGIDWRAHVGGLAGGLVVAAAYAYAPTQRRVAWAVAAVAVVVAACVALLTWRTNELVPLLAQLT
jgi:membrane associated rhomboid family serine protease